MGSVRGALGYGGVIVVEPLPPHVCALLDELDAPPRLVAHLTLVHDVASQLVSAVDAAWPDFPYDREAVLIGAAMHDIGKVLHPYELSGPGRQHENVGVALLLQHGFSLQQARFARTHGAWCDDPAITLEDLLVALADKIWRGKRDAGLENALVQHIVNMQKQEPWAAYLALGDAIRPIAEGADARLTWQAQYPV